MLLDAYAYGNRWRQLNPTEKGLLTGLALLAALAARSPLPALVVFTCMAVLTVVGAGIPFLAYLRLLLLPAGFLLAGVASLVISFAGGDIPLGTLPWLGLPVFLSEAGLAQAALVLARSLGAVAALYFLALTTPMTEIIGLLRRLRVPVLLLELMVLAYRQIFVFLQIARKMRVAQASRLGYATTGTSFRSLASLGANLFLRAHHRSQLLHRSLVCRGYEDELRWLERDYPRSNRNLLLAAGVGGGLLVMALLV
ncbi:cobalt ECF transporter T component CbiQ [Trichloromonas sp.]|uniref:cobalt ECF transporter T component CbiQ n=1 Tax=Trichloromonas sp. TaxID=3069249 RepID=UPI003D81B88E